MTVHANTNPDAASTVPEPKRTNIPDAEYFRRVANGFGALASISVLLLILAKFAHAETLSVHGPWAAFKADENGKPVCYIGAKPEKAEGNYTRRGDTYVLVTHRPALKENDVVSVRAGYTYKANSQVVIKIGSNTMNLSTNDGHAWTPDAKSDSALVQAMKKGSTMVVNGTSSRGTLTTDTYSLSGFTAAYKASRGACGL